MSINRPRARRRRKRERRRALMRQIERNADAVREFFDPWAAAMRGLGRGMTAVLAGGGGGGGGPRHGEHALKRIETFVEKREAVFVCQPGETFTIIVGEGGGGGGP